MRAHNRFMKKTNTATKKHTKRTVKATAKASRTKKPAVVTSTPTTPEKPATKVLDPNWRRAAALKAWITIRSNRKAQA